MNSASHLNKNVKTGKPDMLNKSVKTGKPKHAYKNQDGENETDEVWVNMKRT